MIVLTAKEKAALRQYRRMTLAYIARALALSRPDR